MNYEKRIDILSSLVDLIRECDTSMLHEVARLIAYRMQRLESEEAFKKAKGHVRNLRLERSWLTIGSGVEVYIDCAAQVNIETAIAMLEHDFQDCDEETRKLMIVGLNVFIEFGAEAYYTGLIKNQLNGGWTDEAARTKTFGVDATKVHHANQDSNIS